MSEPRPDAAVGAAPESGTRGRADRAGFLLDLSRCTGCGSCSVACRIENDLPRGLSWRRVVSVNLPRWEGGPTYHFSLACHHCESPPCAKACPTGALSKRPDGVVSLKSNLCIGCQYCSMACPFDAPAYYREAGVMTKCTLCAHRLDQFQDPACVDACPTRALRFSWELHAKADAVRPDSVPGFADPGKARPSIRFVPPGGGIRRERYEALLDRLDGRRKGTRRRKGSGS
jgi:anaerobic dimethyl sulfoxide reductase subunit B (iron-sulfur subunit)